MRQAARAVRGLAVRFSLRTNLAFLILAAVAILVFDRAQELTRIHSEQIARAEADMLATARDGAELQAAVVTEAKALLRVVAGLPITAADSGLSCREPFRNIVSDVSWLRSMFVVDATGRAQCADVEPLSTRSIGDRKYFKDATASRDFVLSDYIVGRYTGRPVIVGVVPRIKNGAVETVVGATVELDLLDRIAAEVGNRHGAEVMLLDSEATVVAAYPQPKTWVGQSLADRQAFTAILAGPDGTIRSDGFDGVERIISHAKLRDTNAVLVAMQPLDGVIAGARRQAEQEIGKIILAGIASFIVIWFGSERLLLGPVRTLADSAARLGRGDLSARIATEGLAPELKRLGDSFNDMGAQLRERDAELRLKNDKLSELASKDALTGIANRRGFDQNLANEWNRVRRTGRPMALLVVDVDHFKRFNDRYGHVAGDDCLRQVAGLLDTIARRAGDFAARIGGEEFAVLLPATDLGVAGTIAETVRARIELLDIPHEDSPEARVTVSVGVAAVDPADGGSIRSLFDCADSALYRAKRGGRNRVALDWEAISLAS